MKILSRTHIIFSTIGITSLFLTACAPISAADGVKPYPKPHPKPQPIPAENNIQSKCGAENFQYLVGKDRKVLETMRFGNTVRIEVPGMGYTMDYREDRMRIQIGEDNKIHRVLCG